MSPLPSVAEILSDVDALIDVERGTKTDALEIQRRLARGTVVVKLATLHATATGGDVYEAQKAALRSVRLSLDAATADSIEEALADAERDDSEQRHRDDSVRPSPKGVPW